MTDDELINAARRAAGSEVLPRVMLGAYRADALLLKMADRIEALIAEVAEWRSLAEAAIRDDAAKNVHYAEVQHHAERAETERDVAVATLEKLNDEVELLRVLVAGLEPKRQEALESGEPPANLGERLWASIMRMRAAIAIIKGKGCE
jgi:hypothetical protein